MIVRFRVMLTCPVCGLELRLEDRTYRCDRGHAFDRAREGHVDLLPPGHGRSRLTGDTRAMARARQRFLDGGHHRALLDLIARRIAGTAHDTGIAIAEAGCGTGYYIGGVVDRVPGATGFGFDVSREALRIAARAHPLVTFARNDVAQRITLADGSVDRLLDVFAPRNPAEFHRVLRPDGTLIVVIPGPGHIGQLRGRLPLLAIDADKRERLLDRLETFFDPVWEERLQRTTRLDRMAITDLVRMGPTAHHIADRELELAAAAGPVTLDFVVLGLRRRASPDVDPDAA